MLQNGTCINKVKIDKPHRLITATTISTQAITAVTSSQYGNKPTGSYNLGDEYICEVAPGIKYNFFVIGILKAIG